MHSAPSSHWYITASRWVGLTLTALLIAMQQRPVGFWSAWGFVAGVLLVATIFAQPYIRTLFHIPMVAALELSVATIVVAFTGAWTSPFFILLLSMLVLPALLYGRSGGVTAGFGASIQLACVLLLQGSWADAGAPAVPQRLLLLALPPLVGYGVATLYANRRVARLHVPVLPALPSLGIGALVRRAVPRSDGGRGARRGDGATQVQTRVAEVRVALYTPSEATGDIVTQLHALAGVYEATAHVAVRCVVLGRPKPIPAVHHDTMRRLVIEALLNVEQHADAQSVSLLVRFDQRTVTILVQDDGVGLPDSGIYRAGLHTLQMLVYRIAEVGGRLEVFTPSSGGVAVRAIYPLQVDEVIV